MVSKRCILSFNPFHLFTEIGICWLLYVPVSVSFGYQEIKKNMHFAERNFDYLQVVSGLFR